MYRIVLFLYKHNYIISHNYYRRQADRLLHSAASEKFKYPHGSSIIIISSTPSCNRAKATIIITYSGIQIYIYLYIQPKSSIIRAEQSGIYIFIIDITHNLNIDPNILLYFSINNIITPFVPAAETRDYTTSTNHNTIFEPIIE